MTMEYSVWAVPYNWREVKAKYMMDFIPHVSLSKNHKERPVTDKKAVSISFRKHKQGSVHVHGPLKGFGFDCHVSGHGDNYLPIYFTSIDDYSGLSLCDKMIGSPSDGELSAFLCVAYTFEVNPATWTIIE